MGVWGWVGDREGQELRRRPRAASANRAGDERPVGLLRWAGGRKDGKKFREPGVMLQKGYVVATERRKKPDAPRRAASLAGRRCARFHTRPVRDDSFTVFRHLPLGLR